MHKELYSVYNHVKGLVGLSGGLKQIMMYAVSIAIGTKLGMIGIPMIRKGTDYLKGRIFLPLFGMMTVPVGKYYRKKMFMRHCRKVMSGRGLRDRRTSS